MKPTLVTDIIAASFLASVSCLSLTPTSASLSSIAEPLPAPSSTYQTSSISSTTGKSTESHIPTDSQSHSCDNDPYFTIGRKEWEDSDIPAFYRAWESEFRNGTICDADISITHAFIQSNIGVPKNITCGIGARDRCELPDCNRILEAVDGDKEKARKIFFLVETLRKHWIAWANLYVSFMS